MVVDTIKWFHQVMGYPTRERLPDTLNQYYHYHHYVDTLTTLSAKNVNGTNCQDIDMVCCPKETSELVHRKKSLLS